MNMSIVQPRGAVEFPAFTGERIYMREFRKQRGLPSDLMRWQPTVDAMLEGIDVDGPIYLMIDQSVVLAGMAQRRPGMHIDGYWIPEMYAHGGGHGGGRHVTWCDADWKDAEAVILASDVSACRAMVGSWDGKPADGGDCSHIDTRGLREVRLHADRVYAGNVTMLHESLPVSHDCARTLVRLNVPGWSPNAPSA